MRHANSAIVLGLFLGAFPAFATPPDIVSVRDELFGLSDSHLFVLRTTSDNLGLYVTGRNDIFLVAIDRLTGSETLWPIYSLERLPDGGQDGDGTVETTTILTPLDAVNPFDKLAERQGVPWSVVMLLPAAEAGRVVEEVSPDAMTLSYSTGEVYTLSTAALTTGVTAALNLLANTLPDYDRMAPITTRSLLSDLEFAPQDCFMFGAVRATTTPTGAPLHLVRVTCALDDDAQIVSLIRVVPLVAK
jgi:hypothetical protein